MKTQRDTLGDEAAYTAMLRTYGYKTEDELDALVLETTDKIQKLQCKIAGIEVPVKEKVRPLPGVRVRASVDPWLPPVDRVQF